MSYLSYYTVVENAMSSFFNKKNAPQHISKRTDSIYKSMPLDELKKDGRWNKRLDKIIPYIPEGAWLGGGFLRAMIAGEDELDGDIDFFFGTEDGFNKMLDMIKYPTSIYGAEKAFSYYSIPEYENLNKLRIVDCESVVEFRPNIQLVRLFWFDSPEHVIDSFDFTVCQFITDGKTLWYNPQAFEDIKTKTIRFHREMSDSIAVLNRILKYQSKGYKMAPELFKIAEENAVATLNNPGKLSEYFYNDKVENDIHKRSKSALGRAWDYLETAPAASEAYARAMKKKTIPTRWEPPYAGGHTQKIVIDNTVRIGHSWDGS